jgi:hypothetical protein
MPLTAEFVMAEVFEANLKFKLSCLNMHKES